MTGTDASVLTHLCLSSGLVVEHLLAAGYDGYILDLQHGELDTEGALRILQTTSRGTNSAYARLAGLDAAVIARLLDNGCRGIIAPMVESVDQCADLVAACLYPPLGARSYGPVRPDLYEGDDFGDAANEAVLPMIQIESAAGVANAEALLSMPGVKGVYLGPADLARSYGLGFGTDWTTGPVWDAIVTVSAAARVRGVRVGIFCKDPGYAASLRNAGLVDFIGLAGDLMLVGKAARNDLAIYDQSVDRS
ncbi:aldolase [Rhodococcus hoagii]|nr:aldolase [Prescottella equi]